ncbi:MAG: GNAT family N-acetyltransferase [Candidatus Aenigmarchaeota archaeon]|nr:GNAT family N-acetyltransferase [Candidatus Aenigmarchaeota archaeon]
MVKFVGRGSYKPPENLSLQRQVVREMIGQVIPVYREEFGGYAGAYRAGVPSLQVERGSRPWLYVCANGGDSFDRDGVNEDTVKKVDAALERIENRVHALLRAHRYSKKVYWCINSGGRAVSTHIRPYHGTYTCSECEDTIEDNFSVFKAGHVPACANRHEHTVFSDPHFTQLLHLKEPKVVFEEAEKRVSRVAQLDRRAFRVAEELNLCAKEDENSFLRLDLERFSRGEDRLYFLQEQKIPVGYILWNNMEISNLPTVRQLFVQSDYRKRGLGTLLMRETVKKEAGEGIFVAESPNRKSINIMLRLGYAEKNPDGSILGKRVSFVSGM